MSFYKKHYQMHNIVVVISGSIPHEVNFKSALSRFLKGGKAAKEMRIKKMTTPRPLRRRYSFPPSVQDTSKILMGFLFHSENLIERVSLMLLNQALFRTRPWILEIKGRTIRLDQRRMFGHLPLLKKEVVYEVYFEFPLLVSAERVEELFYRHFKMSISDAKNEKRFQKLKDSACREWETVCRQPHFIGEQLGAFELFFNDANRFFNIGRALSDLSNSVFIKTIRNIVKPRNGSIVIAPGIKAQTSNGKHDL
jgi:predicted Zn-dependent peptidase